MELPHSHMKLSGLIGCQWGGAVCVDTALDFKTTPLFAESSRHFLESNTSSLATLLSGREGCQQELSNRTLLHVPADFIVSPFRHCNGSSLFPVPHPTFIFIGGCPAGSIAKQNPQKNRILRSYSGRYKPGLFQLLAFLGRV